MKGQLRIDQVFAFIIRDRDGTEGIAGWLNPATIPAFVDYAAKIVAALKDRVYLWNTFNEPDTYASLTYLLGGFPPFHKWRLGQYRPDLDFDG